MAADRHALDLVAFHFEIARISPEFDQATITRLGEGMDSVAVLVDDTFVFRFAKHAQAALGLRREIALLPRLAPTLPLAIPRFDYVGEHSATGLPFVGYRVIRGEPVDRSLYDRLSVATQDGVQRDLAAFLTAVHAFSIEEAAACGVPPEGGRADYIEDLRRARDDVFPLLDPTVGRMIEFQLAAFLDDDANFGYAPVLLHADLWPEHILFSRDAGRLAGVIDFGDVSIGDPDYDLPFLARRLGSAFMAGLLGHYPHANHVRLGAKLRAFSLINAIDDVFIGLDQDDRRLVDSALADLAEQSRVAFF
jgi:aminoglycoside 2''-phosphotransferase